MFITALFLIARTWKQPRCPSADEWIRKLWYIYTMEYSVQFSSVQSLSSVQLFVTPWIEAHQASLSITNSQSSLKLNVHRVSDAIQPSHPLSSTFPPAPSPSQHQSLVQWVNSSHEVAKVLEYYSAIKKNTFESVLVRWMKLEPTIQSEVSQKEKHQYSILTHIYGIKKDGNDNPVCKTAKETQMYRTVFWTLWEKVRAGWYGRMALKHVNYRTWNESPVQV